MGLSNYKLTDAAVAQKGVVAAPDKLTGEAAENKAVFDRLIREAVQGLYNALIDALSGTSGAGEIGTTAIEGVTGEDVQTVLGSLKTILDTKSARSDMEEALALKSDKSVTDLHFKSVSLDAATGVLTFTREDESSVTVNTAPLAGGISLVTPTDLSGVLFGNGSNVLARALDDASGAASTTSLGKAFADLAPVEASGTASQAYAVNGFLVYNGQLYRVTAAIAQGDTLMVGTNIAAADAGTYLAMVAAANAVENAGVAPGGFGLGATAGKLLINTDDCDNCTEGGMYYWGPTVIPAHAPPTSTTDSTTLAGNGVLCVYPSEYGVVQEVRYYRDPWGRCFRYKYGSTWTPWEFENPRLAASKEYRTTERWKGKPVYQKLVGLGAGPNGSVATPATTTYGLSPAISCPNIGTLISMTFTGANTSGASKPIPEYAYSGGNLYYTVGGGYSSNEGYVYPAITSNQNVSGFSFTVLLKYTKTTD